MRTDVSDGGGLPGRSCGSGRRGAAHLACSATSDEAAADLFRDIKLATGKRARPGNGIARTAVTLSFRLKQPEHSFGAVRRPRGDDPTVSFTQRLARTHARSLPGALTSASISATEPVWTIPSAAKEVARASAGG